MLCCLVSGQIAAIYVGNYRINFATTTSPAAAAPAPQAATATERQHTRQTLKSICWLINCPRIFIKLKSNKNVQQVRQAAPGAVQLLHSVLGAAAGDASCRANSFNSHASKLVVKQI